MMLSEAVHRFAPQFMLPLFETMFLLLEYFKQTMTDMTQFVFQTFVFPPIAFTYDTSTYIIKELILLIPIMGQYVEHFAINIPYIGDYYKYVTGNNKKYNEEEEEAEPTTAMINNFNDNDDIINESTTTNNNNNGNNDEFNCGSSFDGSSNTSITDNDHNSSGSDEKDMSDVSKTNVNNQSQGQGQGQRQRQRQQYNHRYERIIEETSDLREELNKKYENVLNYLNNNNYININCNNLQKNISDLTPKRIKKISKYSFDKYNFYKKEYCQYYFNLFKDICKNPNLAIEYLRENINQKYELVMEYKTELNGIIDYGKEKLVIFIELLKQTYNEIKTGKFDYKQATWDICDQSQQTLIRISKHFGPNSLFSTILFKLQILGLLNKVKTFVKGPQIIHQYH